MTGRILIEEPVKTGHSYTIRGSALKNLLLWKPRRGLALTVTDRGGRLFRARCVRLESNEAELLVYEDMGTELPSFKINLLQALPQRERMKLVIEKTTELGVSCIVPFESERSIKREEMQFLQDKSHRWQDWALRASLQSRRPTIPRVEGITSFDSALSSFRAVGLGLILSEHHRSPLIREVLRDTTATSVVLVVGPEGGFTQGELQRAEELGYVAVSTGATILRTETASIFAVGAIAYELTGRHTG